jgi:hypothetical protein
MYVPQDCMLCVVLAYVALHHARVRSVCSDSQFRTLWAAHHCCCNMLCGASWDTAADKAVVVHIKWSVSSYMHT